MQFWSLSQIVFVSNCGKPTSLGAWEETNFAILLPKNRFEVCRPQGGRSQTDFRTFRNKVSVGQSQNECKSRCSTNIGRKRLGRSAFPLRQGSIPREEGGRKLGESNLKCRFKIAFEKYNPRLRFLVRQVEAPLRIAIWVAAVLLSVEILAQLQNAFLAALGSAALAIGLGLQDLIKNLIGGFVVIVARSFQTGDRVRFGDEYGEVKQIGLRSIKVLTDAGMLVTILNADVLTKLIYNANVGVPDRFAQAGAHVVIVDQRLDNGR